MYQVLIDNNHYKLLVKWSKGLNKEEIKELISKLIEYDVDDADVFKALLKAFNMLYESSEVSELQNLVENNNCFYELIFESGNDNDLILGLQETLKDFEERMDE